jgi:hypothetical protein
MSREERESFLMKGDKFRESREFLYGFMLENMEDEHRMLSGNNLVMKVLGKYEHHVDISHLYPTRYCDIAAYSAANTFCFMCMVKTFKLTCSMMHKYV